MAIALNETPPSEKLISFQPMDTPQVDPEYVATLANKAEFGLGKIVGEDKSTIERQFLNGNENEWRRMASAKVDTQRETALNDMISQIAMRGPVGPAENKLIQTAADNVRNNPSDPKTVIEEWYGRQYVQALRRQSDLSDDNTFYSDAQKEIPEAITALEDKAAGVAAYRELALQQKQFVAKIMENESTGSWLLNTAAGFVPFRSEVKLRGLVGDVGVFAGGFLGSNLDKQAESLLSEPFPVYKEKFPNIVRQLALSDPSLADRFIDAVLGKSTSEKFLDNAFSAADIAQVTAWPKGLISTMRKAGLLSASKTAMKDITKSIEANSKTAMLAATGDLEEAAVHKATTNIVELAQGTARTEQQFADGLVSFFVKDADSVKTNPNGYANLVNKIQENYDYLTSKFMNILTNTGRPERLPEVLANEVNIRAVQKGIKNTYPGNLSNAVIDVSPPTRDKITGGYKVDIHIGTTEGNYFASREQAENFAYAHSMNIVNPEIKEIQTSSPFPKSFVEQQGLGYYLKETKVLPETADFVRDLIGTTNASKSPSGFVNSLLGRFSRFRTPEDTLSLDQRMNRKAATYGPANLNALAQEAQKPIQKLGSWTLPFTQKRKDWNEWIRTLEAARHIPDENNLMGRSFRTIGEFTEHFQNVNGHLPNQKQVEAYFAFNWLNQMDHSLRNLNVVREMERLGIQEHQFWVTPKGEARRLSGYIPGRRMHDLPGAGNDDVIAIIGNTPDNVTLTSTGRLSASTGRDKQRLIKNVKEGRQVVIELHAPEMRPLSEFNKAIGRERVRYVIVRNVETRPLTWEQLPRRGGGHIEYDYTHYIKQAKMVPIGYGKKAKDPFVHWYEGDTTVMPIELGYGQKIVDHLNHARELLRAGKLDDAKAYVQQHAFMDWKEFKGWFFDKHAPDGTVVPPHLDLHEPFRLVPRNVKIAEMDATLASRYPAFKDGTKKSSLNRQHMVPFTTQRDSENLYTIVEKIGTQGRPVYNYEPAKMIDIVPTMNRAMARIVHSTFLDDYKIFSVEHWLKEAELYIDTKSGTTRDIWSSPYFHFFHPEFRDGTPENIKESLLARHFQINQLIGQTSSIDKRLHQIEDTLNQSFYNKFGSSKLNPSWLIPKISKIPDMLRTIVFHKTLGLYSIPQLWVQTQTFANILGIAGPRYAGQATAAVFFNQMRRAAMMSKVDQAAFLAKMDKYASSLKLPGLKGFKPGEFTEAVQLMERTGFDKVAHEHILRDNVMSTKTIQRGFGRFLDAGTYFFNTGERWVREGAWFTAYQEFRSKVPYGRINDTQLKQILERADLLQVNMSRASASAAHTGIFAVPAQFYSYQLRLAELFFGKGRLTPMERTRLLITNALLYGIPAATAVTGNPFVNNVREIALNNNYVVGTNYLSTLAMEGLPSLIVGLATGVNPSIGTNWGPSGLQNLADSLSGDKTMWDVALGASGTALHNAFVSFDPFVGAVMAAYKGEAFPTRIEDLGNILREVNSINIGTRAAVAAYTGKWLSRNGALLEKDVSATRAIIQSLLGLQNQEIVDSRLRRMLVDKKEDAEKEALNRFVQNFRKGVEAAADNPEQGKQYMIRAFTWLRVLDYPENKWGSAMTLATKDMDKTLIKRLNESFFLKNIPAKYLPERIKGWTNTLKQENR